MLKFGRTSKQGQGRLVEAPWIKHFVVADVGAVSTEPSPFSDHCSNEFEIISSMHIIIHKLMVCMVVGLK